MKGLPELKKGTVVLISVVATITVVATLVAIGSGAVRIGDIFRALKNTNPRAMGFMALPFMIVAFMVARYWYSKREERMWKDAVKKTRAAREQEAAKKETAPE